MRTGNRADHGDGFARRWVGEPGGDGVGPQGKALILELQRLRQAFEQEDIDDRHPSQQRRAARDDPRPAPRQRVDRPKRRRKGRMGRAIDVCLEQFGLNDAAHVSPRNEMAHGPIPAPPQRGPTAAPAQRGPIAAPPQRGPTAASPQRGPIAAPAQQARGPIIAPDDPSLRNRTISGSGPEFSAGDNKDQPAYVESLRLALPHPARNAAAETSVGKVVEKWRLGLVAGAAFLANRDGLADNDNASDDGLTLRTGRAFERELRTGLRVLIAVALLAGGWMALIPLAGAVVVPGNLVVQSNVKTIQHPTGGVVAEIAVHDGMRVSAGDLLVRLDATQAQASLQVVSKQLDEVRARISRLVAERYGLPEPEIPAEMSARAAQSNVATLLASEASLFTARGTARDSQKDLLDRRVAQLGEEIVGLDAQVGSKAKQLELITGELAGVQDLYDKRLVPLTRLTTLQRESARIEGERGQLISSIAETKSKIGEARLQIVRIDQDFRTEVVKELGEAQGKEAEFVERSVAARDMLDRIEIRSPTAGVVHQLAAHTIGGVIRAGDTVMEVVPDSDDLQIEVRLPPNDIDQVRTGQKAFVRFSAFNQRVTPQIIGIVSYVSADTSHDQQSNTPYFTVRVMLQDEERRRLAGLQLVSGMPAEVFMQTGSRTMLSYLLKPITDQLQRAFVER
jgi:HlyD family secretion protein